MKLVLICKCRPQQAEWLTIFQWNVLVLRFWWKKCLYVWPKYTIEICLALKYYSNDSHRKILHLKTSYLQIYLHSHPLRRYTNMYSRGQKSVIFCIRDLLTRNITDISPRLYRGCLHVSSILSYPFWAIYINYIVNSFKKSLILAFPWSCFNNREQNI